MPKAKVYKFGEYCRDWRIELDVEFRIVAAGLRGLSKETGQNFSDSERLLDRAYQTLSSRSGFLVWIQVSETELDIFERLLCEVKSKVTGCGSDDNGLAAEIDALCSKVLSSVRSSTC